MPLVISFCHCPPPIYAKGEWWLNQTQGEWVVRLIRRMEKPQQISVNDQSYTTTLFFTLEQISTTKVNQSVNTSNETHNASEPNKTLFRTKAYFIENTGIACCYHIRLIPNTNWYIINRAMGNGGPLNGACLLAMQQQKQNRDRLSAYVAPIHDQRLKDLSSLTLETIYHVRDAPNSGEMIMKLSIILAKTLERVEQKNRFNESEYERNRKYVQNCRLILSKLQQPQNNNSEKKDNNDKNNFTITTNQHMQNNNINNSNNTKSIENKTTDITSTLSEHSVNCNISDPRNVTVIPDVPNNHVKNNINHNNSNSNCNVSNFKSNVRTQWNSSSSDRSNSTNHHTYNAINPNTNNDNMNTNLSFSCNKIFDNALDSSANFNASCNTAKNINNNTNNNINHHSYNHFNNNINSNNITNNNGTQLLGTTTTMPPTMNLTNSNTITHTFNQLHSNQLNQNTATQQSTQHTINCMNSNINLNHPASKKRRLNPTIQQHNVMNQMSNNSFNVDNTSFPPIFPSISQSTIPQSLLPPFPFPPPPTQQNLNQYQPNSFSQVNQFGPGNCSMVPHQPNPVVQARPTVNNSTLACPIPGCIETFKRRTNLNLHFHEHRASFLAKNRKQSLKDYGIDEWQCTLETCTLNGRWFDSSKSHQHNTGPRTIFKDDQGKTRLCPSCGTAAISGKIGKNDIGQLVYGVVHGKTILVCSKRGNKKHNCNYKQTPNDSLLSS